MSAEIMSKRDPAADRRAIRSREAILAAAARLLTAGGDPEVSPTRIAAEAGVGRATLYRHWPEPEDLLLEAMELLIPSIDLGAGPISEKLKSELRSRLGWFNSPAAGASIAKIASRGDQEPRIRLMGDRTLGVAKNMLSDAISRAAQDGELRPDTPADILAKSLIGSLVLDRHLLGNLITEEQVDTLTDALLSKWIVDPQDTLNI